MQNRSSVGNPSKREPLTVRMPEDFNASICYSETSSEEPAWNPVAAHLPPTATNVPHGSR